MPIGAPRRVENLGLTHCFRIKRSINYFCADRILDARREKKISSHGLNTEETRKSEMTETCHRSNLTAFRVFSPCFIRGSFTSFRVLSEPCVFPWLGPVAVAPRNRIGGSVNRCQYGLFIMPPFCRGGRSASGMAEWNPSSARPICRKKTFHLSGDLSGDCRNVRANRSTLQSPPSPCVPLRAF